MQVVATDQILRSNDAAKDEKLKIVVEEIQNLLNATTINTNHNSNNSVSNTNNHNTTVNTVNTTTSTVNVTMPSEHIVERCTDDVRLKDSTAVAVNIVKDSDNNNNNNGAITDSSNTNNNNQEQNDQLVTSGRMETTPFAGISQLLPTLYLSGAGVAMPHILDQLAVRFIVNVAPELPDTPLSDSSRPLYLRVHALDRPDVDLATHFDTVADMIEEVRQHGGKTLVHCVAGVSRSASLCIAYLMKHAGMSLRDAYQHVKAIRPQIRPNSGFFEQLRQYEVQLRGSTSVRMVYYESLNKEIPDVYEPEYRAMEEFYQRHRNALKRR